MFGPMAKVAKMPEPSAKGPEMDAEAEMENEVEMEMDLSSVPDEALLAEVKKRGLI